MFFIPEEYLVLGVVGLSPRAAFFHKPPALFQAFSF
jgi:hypothetical protein